MRNSPIFSIATTLTHLPEGYQLGIFIPPKVELYTASDTDTLFVG
jgi:hypothetical protein